MPSAAPPLYHVTLARRLPSIARHGLVVSAVRAIGAPSLDAHVKGRIFLTERQGVYFWFHRAEDFAEAGSDDLWKDLAIPVVLRVHVGHRLVRGRLALDEIGSLDALARAWMAGRPIPPTRLAVWNGRRWTSLDAITRADLKAAVYRDAEGYVYFRQGEPLLPPECRP